MRYFKYKNVDAVEKKAQRTIYAEMTAEEKRIFRRDKVLTAVGMVLSFGVGLFCIGLGIWGIESIPLPANVFLMILSRIGMFVLKAIVFIGGICLGVYVGVPIANKIGSRRYEISRSIQIRACEHLREYYGLQEPCIVTKCYESSEKRFTNHDVCIFVVGEELRITTNLKHGFYHGRNDLGCYAFEADEITIKKQQGEKFLIAELRAGETVFLLGYRAKGFIENNFLSRQDG